MTVYNARIDKRRAALSYAARGKPVFPCRGKRPLTKNGFKDATTDPRRIDAWWERWPEANIGMPTGKRSGVWALDVDADRGGFATLAALLKEHGALPDTAMVSTGGGGVHLYFNYPADTEIRNGADVLGPGLDVRGEGGYVLLPGSVTDSPYEWLESSSPATAPAWVIEFSRHRENPAPEKLVSGTPLSVTAITDAGGPIHEGTRNDTLTRIAGRLHDGTRDLSDLAADLLAINEARCAPPLPEAEVVRIAESIYSRSPCSPGPSQDALEALADFVRQLERAAWPGMRGKSVRSFLAALVKLAEKHGKVVEDGVRVSASVAQLNQTAALSKPTVMASAAKAESWGWIRRDHAEASGTRSGAYVLLFGAGKEHPHGRARFDHSIHKVRHTEGSNSTGTPDMASGKNLRAPLSAARLRWRGLLGKSAEHALDVLEAAAAPLSVRELGERMGMKRPRDLRRKGGVLERLLSEGIIERRGDEYALVEVWLERVNEAREAGGELDDLRRDIKRNAARREAYRQRHKHRPERIRKHRAEGTTPTERKHLVKVARSERRINPHKERITEEERMQRAYDYKVEQAMRSVGAALEELDRRREERRKGAA